MKSLGCLPTTRHQLNIVSKSSKSINIANTNALKKQKCYFFIILDVSISINLKKGNDE